LVTVVENHPFLSSRPYRPVNQSFIYVRRLPTSFYLGGSHFSLRLKQDLQTAYIAMCDSRSDKKRQLL
jgi:hypothetical protein